MLFLAFDYLQQYMAAERSPMGTYTSRHLFAKMFLLSISSFGFESS